MALLLLLDWRAGQKVHAPICPLGRLFRDRKAGDQRDLAVRIIERGLSVFVTAVEVLGLDRLDDALCIAEEGCATAGNDAIERSENIDPDGLITPEGLALLDIGIVEC